MEQPRAKVISCIHTDEEFVPNAEDQVFYFFTKFISELTSEELELLLLFITGSLHQPQIIVTFNGQPGLNQHPTAHTSDNVIELPFTFNTMREFCANFCAVPSIPDSFVFSVL